MPLLRSGIGIVLVTFVAGAASTSNRATQGATAATSRSRAGTATIANDPSETCPVTRPPDPPFVPPAPYPAEPPSEHQFWFGTQRLWTLLPVDGTWRGLRPYSPTTPGFRQKVFWWRKDYDCWEDPKPELTVEAKRLDAAAPSFFIPRATSGYEQHLKSFMLVGADFPTRGCWEVTGRFKGDELSFVVWVAP